MNESRSFISKAMRWIALVTIVLAMGLVPNTWAGGRQGPVPAALANNPSAPSIPGAKVIPAPTTIGRRPTPPPQQWGAGNSTEVVYHAMSFHEAWDNTTYSVDSKFGRYRTGGTGFWFDHNIALPQGSMIDSVEVALCDSNATNDITFWFNISNGPGSAPTSYSSGGTGGNVGCTYQTINLSTNSITVDNFWHTYFVEVRLNASDATNSFYEVRVYYHRQISPAPATATFTDVPTTHAFFQFVEALAASGITTGCSATQFCPSQPVTRGQMAAFLARALGLYWPD